MHFSIVANKHLFFPILQFILFASIVAFAAAYPGYYGHEYAELEAAHHDYGQIERGDSHEHHYEHQHHDDIVDYYVGST